MDDLLEKIREVARSKIVYLPHAVRQMSRPDRMISTAEISSVVQGGELIEDYPEDQRGHSGLILGFGDANRPLHVVCSPKTNYLAIITAYLPDPNQWSEDLKRRLS